MWLCGKKDVRIQTNRPCKCKKLKPFSPSLSKIPSYAYLLLQLLQLWRQSLWACRWVRQHRIEQNPRFQRKHIFFIKIAGSTWLGLLEWEKLPIFDEKRWPSLAKSKTDATCLGGTPCSWSQDLWKKPLRKNPIDFKSLHSPKHLGLEPENWPSPAEEEILLLWHHHFQANRLGGSTICKQNKPQLSQVIQGFIIIGSTSMLKLSCSVVDRDTSQGIRKWCASRKMKIWLRSIFQKKRSKYCHWSGTNMLWKLQQIYYIIYLKGAKSRWNFLGFYRIRYHPMAFKLKTIHPKQPSLAHSLPGFQRRVVVSKAKLALNIITTSVDSTRVLSFNRRICWPKMPVNDVKVSGMVLFKHLKKWA